MSMGFLNSLPTPNSSISGSSTLLKPGQVLVQFDSGLVLTFAEGAMHTVVTGSTGSGKTTAFIFPALYNLVARGYSGLIIDIKGNLADQARDLALLCGREGDILEIGIGPKSRPINLLANLGEAAIYELYRAMTLKNVEPGHNMVWYQAAIRVVTDVTLLCRHMAAHDLRFTPTLTMVCELLSDFPLCAEIFQGFEKIAAGPEQEGLVRRIKNDCFHPCMWTSKTKGSNRSRDFDEQAEWRTYSTRNALNQFRQTPGVERGFCYTQDSGGLEMEKWIYDQGRIVILRFGPQSGSTGEDLSRSCLETFYQAVFARGLELPECQYTFLVADEFQDFVDFNRLNRFNDNAFTAKSREFNNILIAGTQSLSALLNRGGKKENVESFINNCNNRVMLYSDDPWTQEVANRHEGLHLTYLNPGEAAVVKFNQTSRRHNHGRESLQKAHDTTQARLAEGKALRAERGEGGQEKSEFQTMCIAHHIKAALHDLEKSSKSWDSSCPLPSIDSDRKQGPEPEKDEAEESTLLSSRKPGRKQRLTTNPLLTAPDPWRRYLGRSVRASAEDAESSPEDKRMTSAAPPRLQFVLEQLKEYCDGLDNEDHGGDGSCGPDGKKMRLREIVSELAKTLEG